MSDNVKMTTMNYDSVRPEAENPVKIMDLSLRDGHQSLFATRGRTEDMIPVAELMDEAPGGNRTNVGCHTREVVAHKVMGPDRHVATR